MSENAALRTAFDSIDADRSGFVDKNEFATLCKRLDISLTDDEAANALARLDRSGDGKISFREFADWHSSRNSEQDDISSKLEVMKKKLFSYETIVDSAALSGLAATEMKYEIVETDEYYNITLEVPGLHASKAFKSKFSLTQFGYHVSVSTTVPSLVDTMSATVIKCTRRVGDMTWVAEVRGVFDGKPEVNYKNGLYKMRFRKKVTVDADAADTDF